MRKDVLNHIKNIKEDLSLLNKSELARRLNCDPRTIERYISEDFYEKRKDRNVKSKIDDFKDLVTDKVDSCGANSMAVYRYIKEKGYTGGYHTVNNFINQYKAEQVKVVTEDFYKPNSKMALAEWNDKVIIKNSKGKNETYNIFFIVQGCSNLRYVTLSKDKKQESLFKCLKDSFEFFKIVPKEIIFNNIPGVIDKTATANENNLYKEENKVIIDKNMKKFARQEKFKVIAPLLYLPVVKYKEEEMKKLREEIKEAKFDESYRLEDFIFDFNNRSNEVIQKKKEI